MTTDLTKDQVAELKEAFELFDTNGDGTISREELKEALRLFGQKPTDNQVEDMIKEVDKDGSGSIEFPEFSVLMGKHVKEKDTEVELKAAFNYFDLDGNGFISPLELKQVLAKFGADYTDDEVEDIIREGDQDGDGRISYQEFLDIMQS